MKIWSYIHDDHVCLSDEIYQVNKNSSRFASYHLNVRDATFVRLIEWCPNTDQPLGYFPTANLHNNYNDPVCVCPINTPRAEWYCVDRKDLKAINIFENTQNKKTRIRISKYWKSCLPNSNVILRSRSGHYQIWDKMRNRWANVDRKILFSSDIEITENEAVEMGAIVKHRKVK